MRTFRTHGMIRHEIIESIQQRCGKIDTSSSSTISAIVDAFVEQLVLIEQDYVNLATVFSSPEAKKLALKLRDKAPWKSE
jgi:hypothetical protein